MKLFGFGGHQFSREGQNPAQNRGKGLVFPGEKGHLLLAGQAQGGDFIPLKGEEGKEPLLPQKAGQLALFGGDMRGDLGLFIRLVHCGGRRFYRSVEAQFLNHRVHLQFGEEGVGRLDIPLFETVILQIAVNGGVAVDFCQFAAQVGHLFALLELFADAGFDVNGVQILIDGIYTAKPGDEVQGRLLPDAGHAGDVVAAVPHQSFDLDEL